MNYRNGQKAQILKVKSQVDYKEYLKSFYWKSQRIKFLIKDVSCYCCGAEKWKYKTWKCSYCDEDFLGDKWNYKPYCEYCGNNEEFKQITDGSEYFQLHHLTYKNLGCEKKKEIIILCEDCYRLVHHLIELYPNFLNIKNAPDYVKNEK